MPPRPRLDLASAADLNTWAARAAGGTGILDLFAGPGGWDQALAARHPDRHATTLGIEWDRAAVATRRAAGHLTVRADVATLDPAGCPPIDGLIASPPCQAFSRAGRRAGTAATDRLVAHAEACADGWVDPPGELCGEDVRADLTLQPLRWALALRPRWVALEQVPDVLPLWEATARALDRFGYSTWVGRLNAADYGVPQTRRRAILIARRDGITASPPPTTHYDPRAGLSLFGDLHGDRPWVTMADALGLALADDGRVTRAMVAAGVTGEGRPRPADAPAPTLTGKGAAYWLPNLAGDEPDDEAAIRWAWRRPATTVVSSFRPDVIAAPGWRNAGDGPRQDAPGSIRVTIEEAGVLQSFPADYPWQGAATKRYEQVGNAIPPGLAAAILAPLLVP